MGVRRLRAAKARIFCSDERAHTLADHILISARPPSPLAMDVDSVPDAPAAPPPDAPAALTEAEAEVYDRQLRVWGVESQKR